MVLVLDIGNTRIKCGVFSNNELISNSAFTDIAEFKKFFLAAHYNDICISSVSASVTEKIKKIVSSETGIEPYIISHNSKTNLQIDYKTPESLGIDRICPVEGALLLTGKNIINEKDSFIVSMDCGTATTINVLKSPNIFLGGTISPGINLMFESLNRNTAELPKVTANNYEKSIGQSTSESIASGVINSTLGLLDRIIFLLRNEYSANQIHLFITGGNAEIILPLINYKYNFEKSLVLIGAYNIYKLNS